MHIAVAQVIHETCSFTPAPTTVERFRDGGLREGADVIDGVGGTSALAGFLDAVADRVPEWRMVPLLDASAVAGGPLTADTLAYLAGRLLGDLDAARPIDAVFLSLHGASTAEGEPDVEGYLLESVREIVGEGIPVVASLDHHGNVTGRMISHLDGLVAHRTQPHDPVETGRLAAAQLVSILRGDIRPTIAWRKIPMLAHQEQFATSRGPMRRWFDWAREAEGRAGVVSVSPFPLQPWLDVPEAGWSTVVVTDPDQESAEELAEQHARLAWSMRERFWAYDSVPVEEAVRQAATADRGPVLLSDTGDSVLGGAPGDSPYILAELLRAGISRTALVPIVDPPAVERAAAAGVGSTITTHLGGAVATELHVPVTVTGVVTAAESGPVQADVAGFSTFDMGRSVRLDSGPIRIVVSEREGVGGIHPVVYRRFGLEPAGAGVIVVKTAANFQHYEGMMSRVIRVDSPGPTMSHLERFAWQRIPRPIYPLDDGVEF
jgi:microcystin degradation protein MlrC